MSILTLATIQGVSEAFPISSSAHLMLFSRILGIAAPDKGIDAALHLGTFLALMILMRREVLQGVLGFFDLFFKKDSFFTPFRHVPGVANQQTSTHMSFHTRLFLWACLSSLPSLFLGVILNYTGGRAMPRVAGILSIFFGFLLWFVDAKAPKVHKDPSYFCFKEALFLGSFQALALFSGVSRLGVCLMAARLKGYSLSASTSMAFFIGLVPMAGATALNIFKISVPLSDFMSATALSFAINLPLIVFFNYWARCEKSLFPFFLYRVILGLSLFWIC